MKLSKTKLKLPCMNCNKSTEWERLPMGIELVAQCTECYKESIALKNYRASILKEIKEELEKQFTFIFEINDRKKIVATWIEWNEFWDKKLKGES